MKSIDSETLIPLSIAGAIVVFCCGAYAAFRINEYRDDQQDESIKALMEDRGASAKALASMDKSLAVMAERMTAIEKAIPTLNATRLDVRAVRLEVATLNHNLGAFLPFNPGPMTQN